MGAKKHNDDLGGPTPLPTPLPVLFMFEQIERSLSNLWKNSGKRFLGLETRIEAAAAHFGKDIFSRKDYCQLFKTITPVTASRDLAAGVKTGQLIRQGDKRTAEYQFQ